jgi:hypothetical protein
MSLLSQATVQDIFGKITPPVGTPQFTPGREIDAVIKILNVALNLVMIVGGMFALFNFIWAGFTYMNSHGDPKKISEVNSRLLFTVIGIVVLVLAPVGAAVIGIIVFKDATAILSPKIQTVGP